MIIKTKNQGPRPYRMVIVVRPTLSPERAVQLVQSLTPSNLEVQSQNITMHNLAYTIDGNKQGHLVTMEIQALPEKVWEMRRKLEIEENILRVMSVKNDKKSLPLEIKEENIKAITPYTTKIGKIAISRVPRSAKSKISKTIKRLRFLSILPFVDKRL